MENKELQNAVPNKEPTEKEVREAERQGIIDKKINNAVSENDKARYQQLLNEAKAPIIVKDNDFKMGDGEVDIRKLSQANYRQLMFRQSIIEGARLQSIDTSLLDILRLFMILLKKLGVENITEAIDNLQVELANELKEKTKTE